MHRRHRRWCAVEIKVLTDLGLLFLPSIYRHSGPIGPLARVAVARLLRLKQDLQDVQDLQDGGDWMHRRCAVRGARAFVLYAEKVCKTLMSIETASATRRKGPKGP